MGTEMGMNFEDVLKSLGRCRRADSLRVVGKDAMGAVELDNAVVLCPPCLEVFSNSSKTAGVTMEFDDHIIQDAITRADNRCQCDGCDACDSLLDNVD